MGTSLWGRMWVFGGLCVGGVCACTACAQIVRKLHTCVGGAIGGLGVRVLTNVGQGGSMLAGF